MVNIYHDDGEAHTSLRSDVLVAILLAIANLVGQPKMRLLGLLGESQCSSRFSLVCCVTEQQHGRALCCLSFIFLSQE
jgi:hypothetical protein